jgi:Holliday junction resolvase RusA-like endonuclease
MMQRAKLKIRKIEGEFQCSIILHPPNKRRIDLDNRVKGCLDFCNLMNIIDDDHLCRLLLVVYGGVESAPLGVRMILKPMSK